MTWNPYHGELNKVRYKEPDLQAAYQHYKDMEVFYWVQVSRKYKFPDTTPIQDAWNRFLKLRNHYAYNRRSSDKSPLSPNRFGRAL